MIPGNKLLFYHEGDIQWPTFQKIVLDGEEMVCNHDLLDISKKAGLTNTFKPLKYIKKDVESKRKH